MLAKKDLIDAVTALSAAVAVVAFVQSTWEDREHTKTQEVREWQKVKVFRIVEDHGQIDFASLRREYRADARRNGTIPQEDIQDDALQRVLLGLMANGAIQYAGNRSYRVPPAAVTPTAP